MHLAHSCPLTLTFLFFKGHVGFPRRGHQIKKEVIGASHVLERDVPEAADDRHYVALGFYADGRDTGQPPDGFLSLRTVEVCRKTPIPRRKARPVGCSVAQRTTQLQVIFVV